MAKITTLIPTYQRAHLLQRAIESVQQQSYSDFKIIIFDNASKDETSSVVRRLQKKDERIHYICRAKNIGLIQNFVQAVSHVKTPFFHFLSDDDLLHPHFYQMALEGFEEYPASGMSITRTVITKSNGARPPNQFLRPPLEGFFERQQGLNHLYSHDHCPMWQGILYHQKVLEAVGGLDAGTGTLFDIDLTFQVAAHFPFVATHRIGAFFNLWEKSCSESKKITAPLPNYSRLIERLIPLIEEKELRQKLQHKIEHGRKIGERGIWVRGLEGQDIRGLKIFQKALQQQQDANNDAKLLGKLLWLGTNIPGALALMGALLKLLKKMRTTYLNFRVSSYPR